MTITQRNVHVKNTKIGKRKASRQMDAKWLYKMLWIRHTGILLQCGFRKCKIADLNLFLLLYVHLLMLSRDENKSL